MIENPVTRDDISQFRVEDVLHCAMCLEDKPDNVSPRDWSRLSFGSFHKDGFPGIFFQLWCDRHDCNVTTIYVGTEEWVHNDDLPLRVKEG